jgi:hypothetical protein
MVLASIGRLIALLLNARLELKWQAVAQGRHDTQCKDIQHNDTRHNHKLNATVTLSIQAYHCYAKMSPMLSFT